MPDKEALTSVQFGPFEVDLRTEELRKQGVRLHLPGQSFQILKALLTHPGELVTREELRRELWPSDTFGDFEHGLNAAVNKLRQVLGDGANDSRYIETLPRRGYRFIAPVDGLPTPRLEVAKPIPATQPWRIYSALVGLALVVLVCVTYWLTRPVPSPRVLSTTQLTNDGRDKFVAWESTSTAHPVVTDGSRVYFEEADLGGFFSIGQVSATGGETAAIASEITFPILMDISRTGSELLVRSHAIEGEQPIEILSLPAGARRRVGDLRGHDGAWSPDGQTIVYARDSDLYVARSDGTESRKVVSAAGAIRWPRWSPDGSRIRFTVRNAITGPDSLWEVGRDGTRLHQVLPGGNNPPAECCGNWTPDGKFFVFQSTHNGKTNIWALREGRGFFRQAVSAPVLLTSGGLNFFSPVVSRDGKQIFVIGAVPRGELVRYDTKSRQFLPYLAGISAEGLDFSWDGRWVTYTAYPQGTLWRSKVDSSERIQVTFPPMRVLLPRWSPDAKRIAFAAILPGRRWHVYVVSAEGGQPEQMTHGEAGEVDVGWSPDGTSLVFGSLPPQSQISMLDLSTLRLSTVPGSERIYSPRWSPDGRYLAAETVENDKLMLYDFRTKKWAGWPVTLPNFPSWSRDGKYIYFDTLSSTEPAFVRVRVSDGKAEKIAELKNVRRASSSFGPWSGLAPDDSPLVLRDAGSQEIYALDWEMP